jgi:lupus La protein
MFAAIKEWLFGAPAADPLSPEEQEIRDQMEFYLSPSNVESQAFMKSLVTEREDRYCDISTFLTFNIVKSKGWTADQITRACAASSELELDSTHTRVRTVVPFQPDPRRSFRTIHVEGLDAEETLATLQSLFREIFGKVLRVDMRYKLRSENERYFSGEANVELFDEKTARTAVEQGIEYRGRDLKVILLPDFKQTLNKAGSAPGKKPPKSSRHRS